MPSIPSPDVNKSSSAHRESTVSRSEKFVHHQNIAGSVIIEKQSPFESVLAEHTYFTPSLGSTAKTHPNCLKGDTDMRSSLRPAKRQKVEDSTSFSATSKVKAVSPPWRKAEADGPASFTENGRRKSGRINVLPQEAGRRRLTRHFSETPSETSHVEGHNRGSAKKGSPDCSHSAPRIVSRRSSQVHPAVTENKSHRTRSKPHNYTLRPSREIIKNRRPVRSATPNISEHEIAPTKQENPVFGSHYRTIARTELRADSTILIPLVHPEQVPKRSKIGSSFEDFWLRAGDLSIERGGLRVSDESVSNLLEAAEKEARIIIRIEKELETHGLFSRERCSLFEPDRQDEPPRQWARLDHLVRAMTNFRRLLLAEQQRHRASAKRLADACRDEWLRRQPKSFEQIELDKREYWLLKYRVVVRAVEGLWENVRAHINQQRLEIWEAEEQKRVRAALNEAVCISEQKLQARQETIFFPEDALNDTDLNGSNSGDDSRRDSLESSDTESYDSEIMSSSDDVDDGEKYVGLTDLDDEELSQDQLRIKYANFHKDEAFLEDQKPNVLSDSLMPTTPINKSHSAMGLTAEKSNSGLKLKDGQNRFHLASYHERLHEAASQQQIPNGGNSSVRKEPTTHDVDMFSTEEANSIINEEDELSLVQHPMSIDGEVLEQTLAGDAPSQWATDSETGFTLRYTSEDPGNSGFNGIAKVFDAADSELDNLAETREQCSVRTSSEAGPSVATAESVSSPLRFHDLRAPLAPDSNIEISPIGQRHTSLPGDHPSSTERRFFKESHPGETDKVPSSEGSQSIQVPFLLRGTLREYQYDGLVWLAALYINRTNGILADEMGLGKTIQTIALLAHLACAHEVWGPHLIVVPTSVMLNWEMEFKKWCPSFKVLSYYGSQDERKRKRQGWNNDDMWNVCITSYQLVLQDQQVFRRRRWHYLVLDEAHNIKNFKSQRWQTLLGFNTHSRLLLTGTPLQNNLTELWSLLFFLMPPQRGIGGFADLEEFYGWFQKPESQILESGRDQMDDEAKAIILKLHKVLRPYLLRRLKADVEKQLPNKYEHVNFCRLSKRQRELYDGFLTRTETRATLISGNHLSIINCLMQLRKVCNHPDLFIDRPIVTSMCMQESVASHYEPVTRTFSGLLQPRDLMQRVNLHFLNLIPTELESLTTFGSTRSGRSGHCRTFLDLREAQKTRAQSAYVALNPTSVDSSLAYLEGVSRWDRFEELQHCVYLNALRSQQMPFYGEDLIHSVNVFAFARHYRPSSKSSAKIMQCLEGGSTIIRHLTPSPQDIANRFNLVIQKFSCVTPAVVAKGLERHLLGNQLVNAITEVDLQLSALTRWTPLVHRKSPADPWHEARMRLSIQFPDKRLLQYDCGKLQALDNLLRTLQSNGHRALIFTQMTRVLDILERFLNIHGHRYLRLDGATKVEQRQILTDRFNQDPRILCFILSTRSGGLGINLTGADTVIFYDQDWNPAMDKQCQDRCHRIGQTRDVHIYRLVSEHTIEANILRKASQKQMLDDIVIREGEFTPSKMKQVAVRDILAEKIDLINTGVAAADDALERVLEGSADGKSGRNVGEVLAQAEDKEDATAARIAEREIQADDVDFMEKSSSALSRVSAERLETPGFASGSVEVAAPECVHNEDWNQGIGTVDDFMLHCMTEQLRHTELAMPRGRKKARRRGKESRKR